MSKQAHFKKNSLTWLISLAIMIVLSAAVIVGCVVLDNAHRAWYDALATAEIFLKLAKYVDE